MSHFESLGYHKSMYQQVVSSLQRGVWLHFLPSLVICLAPGLLCLWAIRLASGINVVILFGSVLSSGITFCNKTFV